MHGIEEMDVTLRYGRLVSMFLVGWLIDLAENPGRKLNSDCVAGPRSGITGTWPPNGACSATPPLPVEPVSWLRAFHKLEHRAVLLHEHHAQGIGRRERPQQDLLSLHLPVEAVHA